MLTVLPASPVTTITQEALVRYDVDELVADISGEAEVEKLCDEISFNSFASKLRSWIAEARVRGCIVMHPGLPASQKNARTDKAK